MTCRKCGQNKSARHFYRRSDSASFCNTCRDCHRAYQRQRRIELPDYARSRYLSKYGITLIQYKEMCRKQDNSCAICFGKQKRALSVDHHHASGKVRELLCGSCNALIGLAKESIDILLKAVKYIEKHEPSEPIEKQAYQAISHKD